MRRDYGAFALPAIREPEWHTREAEAQDIHGASRKVIIDHINDDATLRGGCIAEAVADAMRTGYAVDSVVAEVAQALKMGRTWLTEELPLPE